MKHPCDEEFIRSTKADAPCVRKVGPWVLAATVLGSSMAFIDETAVTVVLPAVQDSLDATAVGAQWVVEAYTLVSGDARSRRRLAGGPSGTPAHVRFRRRPLRAGLRAGAASRRTPGSSISGEGGSGGRGRRCSLPQLAGDHRRILRRGAARQGHRHLGRLYRPDHGPGPRSRGLLAENFSWRGVFFINVPLAVAVLAITALHVPESRDAEARSLDLPGAALAAVGLGGIVFGLLESSRAGLGDPVVAGALITGVAALVAFVLVEGRVREPMVPLSLFRIRNFAGANVFTLLLYFALSGTLFFLPFNLIQAQGYSATAAGAAVAPVVVIMFLLSRYTGSLADSFGPRLPLVMGSLVSAAGFVLFTVPGLGATYWTTFFPAAVVLGVGLAILVPAVTTVALNSVEVRHSGLASAINNSFSQIAGLLAVAVLGVIMFRVRRWPGRPSGRPASTSRCEATIGRREARPGGRRGSRRASTPDPGGRGAGHRRGLRLRLPGRHAGRNSGGPGERARRRAADRRQEETGGAARRPGDRRSWLPEEHGWRSGKMLL